MSPVSDDAIVLQVFPYSESSLIVRLLTRGHGVRSVIAKGARRRRGGMGSGLDPFNQGAVTVYLREGRDLHTLGDFDLARSRRALGRDLLRFGGAALLAEIIVRTGSEEAQPALFERFGCALDRVEDAVGDSVEPRLLSEVWGLIGSLGFAPALEQCIGCGRSFGEDEATTFDYHGGGLRCSSCAGGGDGRSLPPHARSALLRMNAGDAVALERTAAHWQLVRRFLVYHVLEGSRLRSFTFLERALAVS